MRLRASTLLLIIGLFAGADPVLASTVPQLIPYSGSLTGPNGHPLPTGDYTLTFRIYGHPTSTDVGPVWGPQVFDGETKRGHGDKVPVVKGFFNVILGPVDVHGNPIAKAFRSSDRFSSDRFVEVTLEGGPPNLPRHQVLSTPFALSSLGETPVGGIIMYSGRESELPVNWQICRGQQIRDRSSPLYQKRVPDLRGLFVRGASNQANIGDVDGRDERDTHTHDVSVNARTKRDELNGYITRTLLCFYHDCDPTDFDITRTIDNTILRDPHYLALVKRKESKDSHGHHIRTHSDVSWDKQTSMDNRPKHMNLHYIIRIK